MTSVDEPALSVTARRRFWRTAGDRQNGAGRSRLKGVVLIGPAGQIVCERCYVADRSFPRLRGLIGWRPLDRNEGMLLRPSSAIHTTFVRFAIDAVFLDDEMTVLSIAPNLKPWRAAWKRRASAVLELPSGRCEQLGLRPGDVFAWGRLS